MSRVADESEFSARLRTWVRGRVPSSADADDVVQTVLLKLVESGRVESLTSTHAWLRATARNVIADLHRSRASRSADSAEVADVASAEEDDDAEISRCLGPLLARLEPADRDVIQRVDVDGVSQAALARELALSASGMKSRVQRARARLRDAVLARCVVEFDGRGRPVGAPSCRPGDDAKRCGCD